MANHGAGPRLSQPHQLTTFGNMDQSRPICQGGHCHTKSNLIVDWCWLEIIHVLQFQEVFSVRQSGMSFLGVWFKRTWHVRSWCLSWCVWLDDLILAILFPCRLLARSQHLLCWLVAPQVSLITARHAWPYQLKHKWQKPFRGGISACHWNPQVSPCLAIPRPSRIQSWTSKSASFAWRGCTNHQSRLGLGWFP